MLTLYSPYLTLTLCSSRTSRLTTCSSHSSRFTLCSSHTSHSPCAPHAAHASPRALHTAHASPCAPHTPHTCLVLLTQLTPHHMLFTQLTLHLVLLTHLTLASCSSRSSCLTTCSSHSSYSPCARHTAHAHLVLLVQLAYVGQPRPHRVRQVLPLADLHVGRRACVGHGAGCMVRAAWSVLQGAGYRAAGQHACGRGHSSGLVTALKRAGPCTSPPPHPAATGEPNANRAG